MTTNPNPNPKDKEVGKDVPKDATKKPQVTDPLEAAKITAPPVAPPPAPVVIPAPVAVSAPVIADAPSKIGGKKYRVTSSTYVSIQGQLVRLNTDDVVSEESYGPVGMQRILDSNVPLTEIK